MIKVNFAYLEKKIEYAKEEIQLLITVLYNILMFTYKNTGEPHTIMKEV